MLGERDVHHARRLHVPGQSGAAAGALAGADIDRHARARHRLPGDPRRHQVREKLRQPVGLAAGNLPRLLQQQTRAKSGERTTISPPSVIHRLSSSIHAHIMPPTLPRVSEMRRESSPESSISCRRTINTYAYSFLFDAVFFVVVGGLLVIRPRSLDTSLAYGSATLVASIPLTSASVEIALTRTCTPCARSEQFRLCTSARNCSPDISLVIVDIVVASYLSITPRVNFINCARLSDTSAGTRRINNGSGRAARARIRRYTFAAGYAVSVICFSGYACVNLPYAYAARRLWHANAI